MGGTRQLLVSITASQFFGKHARQVVDQSAAGDMSEAVNHLRAEPARGAADSSCARAATHRLTSAAKPANLRRRLEPHLLEKNFARERVAVRVQTVRRQTEDDVARFDPAAIDHLCAIDHADDAAGEIVFAFAIHARHLRGLAADEGATRLPGTLWQTGEQLIERPAAPSLSAPM